jgi:RHS repeat-associated protein
LLSETDPTGGAQFFTYDPMGRLVAVKDALGRTTRYTFDTQGNRTRRTNAAGGTETWEYDPSGRIVSYTDPLGRRTKYSYDARGQLVQTTDPSGRSITDDYDAAGQLVQRAYADNTSVRFTYDQAGRRSSMTDTTGTTTYGYGAGGTMTSMTQPDGATTAFKYDVAGRRVSMTAPDGTTLDYTYNGSGRVASITPRHHLADTFTGPDGNQPDAHKWRVPRRRSGSVKLIDNTAVLHVADAREVAILSSASRGLKDQELALTYRMADLNPSAVVRFAVRSSDVGAYWLELTNQSGVAKLVRKNGSGTRTLASFAYKRDTNKHRIRLRAQGSDLKVRVWDAASPEPDSWNANVTDNHVRRAGTISVTLRGSGGSHAIAADDLTLLDLNHRPRAIVTYRYDRDGHLVSQRLPDGERRYRYHRGELARFSQNLMGRTHTTLIRRDAAGRITKEITRRTSTKYNYDLAGQLIGEAGSDRAIRFSYDVLGRRTAMTAGNQQTKYAYNAASELLATESPAGTTRYTYDAVGRRLTQLGPTESTKYTYDGAGRLATLTRQVTSGRCRSLDQCHTSDSTQTRSYDGDGRLRSATTNQTHVGTAPLNLTWDPTTSIPTLIDVANGADRATLFGAGARKDGFLTGLGAQALAQDAQGSVIGPSSSPLPTLAARSRTYGAFGHARDHDPGLLPRLGYRGELTTGDLVYLQTRDYDSVVGAFTTPDRLDGVDGTTTVAYRYNYADNDPLNRVDPRGEFSVDDSEYQLQLVGLFGPGPFDRQKKRFTGFTLWARGGLGEDCLTQGTWCTTKKLGKLKAEATGQSHAIRKLSKSRLSRWDWFFDNQISNKVDWEVGPTKSFNGERIDIATDGVAIYEAKVVNGAGGPTLGEVAEIQAQLGRYLNNDWALDDNGKTRLYENVPFYLATELGDKGWAISYEEPGGFFSDFLSGPKLWYAWADAAFPGMVFIARDEKKKVPDHVKKRAHRGDPGEGLFIPPPARSPVPVRPGVPVLIA